MNPPPKQPIEERRNPPPKSSNAKLDREWIYKLVFGEN